ncbi:MAG: NAD+ synthase [Methanocellales archaeon]|nr:NAD+ synthase [Methanocellales archaeon]
MPADLEKVVERITAFIKTNIKKAGREGAVIGLSGGVDSTLVAALAVRALGKGRVLGLLLPEKDVTRAEDVQDAMQMVKMLDIKHKTIEISEILDAFASMLPNYDPRAKVCSGNLKARIRMCALYYYANLLNLLVIGTSNKTEILLGYTTKYGDAAADILPLGTLYKTQVLELAKYLGIPEHIIKKPPSAGLWKGQSDEKELGISYELADSILMKLIDERRAPSDIKKELSIPEDVIERIVRRVEENKHKREMAPIPEI